MTARFVLLLLTIEHNVAELQHLLLCLCVYIFSTRKCHTLTGIFISLFLGFMSFQILDIPEELIESHDLTVDYILTPTRVIKTNCQRPKPQGIIWSKVRFSTGVFNLQN